MPFKEDEQSVPIQKYRDVLKSALIKGNDKATYVVFGVENQAEIHYAMVVRNMLYDAIDYATQVSEMTGINRDNKVLKNSAEFLSGMKKDDKIIPVVTIVIYWGTDKWDGAKTLHELLDTDEEILEYVPNYFLNLIAPAEIKDFDKFTTELGIVLQCVKNAKDKRAFKKMIKNDKSLLSNINRNTAELISELTNVKIELEKEKGDELDMGYAIDDIMADVKEVGMAIERISTIRKNKHKFTVEDLADFYGTSEESINQIINLIDKYPTEDDAQIAERILPELSYLDM